MKIAIIGAGPAGIYSTLLLKDFTGTVTLFDQNKDIGEKLKMTGGGRMNVTNKCFTDTEFNSQSVNLLKRLFKNPHIKHRESILSRMGVDYVWEKSRAILRSQDAIAEVARLKELIVNQENARLQLESRITSIRPQEGGFRIGFETKIGTTHEDFDRVILSGGGMFRVKDLGDNQKIYALPLSLGHTITAVSPSLSPLFFADKSLRPFSGIALEARLTDPKTKQFIEDDLLLTHFGLSGPAVLDFSSVLSGDCCELSFIIKISEVDFRKKLNDLRLGSHRIRGFLKEFLPQRLVDFHLERVGLDRESNVSDCPKVAANDLIKNIFHFPINDIKKGAYPASWTTKGGVNLSEINTATLESKLHPGLYFAGEIIDVNGLCGGFNISFAAVSAQIVAEALCKNSQDSKRSF